MRLRRNLSDMSSGPIFLLILVIWAVVLAPVVMRMYERNAPTRSARKFSHAMSALSHAHRFRTPADVMLVRRARRHSHVLLDPMVDHYLDHGDVPLEDSQDAAAGGPTVSRAAVQAAMRRRRTVACLLAATRVLLVTGVLGLLPLVLVLMPMGLLTAFVLLSRRQMVAKVDRRAAESARSARRTMVQRAAAVDVVVPPVRRHLEPTPTVAAEGAGSPRPRLVATGDDAVLAATYDSEEERLGLIDYISSPSLWWADRAAG